jgi:hypothetical protein
MKKDGDNVQRIVPLQIFLHLQELYPTQTKDYLVYSPTFPISRQSPIPTWRPSSDPEDGGLTLHGPVFSSTTWPSPTPDISSSNFIVRSPDLVRQTDHHLQVLSSTIQANS